MAETALRAEAPAPQYGSVPPSVQVSELSRRFGDITAVDGISFEVGEAEIFGFLGPNGAGKTTTISMLCTLLTPTAGRATIGGHDIVDESGRRAPRDRASSSRTRPSTSASPLARTSSSTASSSAWASRTSAPAPSS